MGHRELFVWIALGTLLRLVLAVVVTDGVLVDDAYITLRYAVNGAETGALVYNHGEPVFGVTSPLWGFATTGLALLVGRAWLTQATLGLGFLLWALVVRRVGIVTSEVAGPGAARLATAFLLFTPVFVDNQLLGMETPLVVWLAIEALSAARLGQIKSAAIWTGLLAVARPEGVLFAPALLFLGSSGRGFKALLLDLARPRTAALILAPGLLWIAFALHRYGTVLPQSMLAKSGWNSAHYDSIGTLANAWFGVARLTFAPFVDYLPSALAHGLTALIVAAVATVAVANVRAGTTWSRAAFGTYVLYIGFYLVGKGATEASWYAIPSSALLVVAATPLFAALPMRTAKVLTYALAALLTAGSWAYAERRAPLLQSYVNGYGACADVLESRGPAAPGESVLIGEIGVFGYRTTRRVIDVGALVSPEVLPVKNRGVSLLSLIHI